MDDDLEPKAKLPKVAKVTITACIQYATKCLRPRDLPLQTHSMLITQICELLPIRYELLLCYVSFIVQCLSSDNSVVCTVSHYSVYFRHTLSHIGAYAIFCWNYLDVILSHIGRINKQFVWCVYRQSHITGE